MRCWTHQRHVNAMTSIGRQSGGSLQATSWMRCTLKDHRRSLLVVAPDYSVGASLCDKASVRVSSHASASTSEQASAGSTSSNDKEAAKASKGSQEVEKESDKSDNYTEEMQAKMGTVLTYRHEDGINWNQILPDLVVGSCLQTPEDVDRLAEAGIETVFCLQEDSDLEYFSIDIDAIAARCAERGDIKHVRFRIRDFDPFDLRRKLPKAVSRLALAHNPKLGGQVYIHCTAGLGRAPAVALAYMHWLRGWDLDEAYASLTSVRRCSPRIEAIRAATADLLTGAEPVPATVSLPNRSIHKVLQVAGLDMGWHNPVDMVENPVSHRMEVTRLLLPGDYPFKFILDGHWCASARYPMIKDGANNNNVLSVLPRAADKQEQRGRLLSPSGKLTEEERLELASMLCPWATHQQAKPAQDEAPAAV